MIVSVVAAIIFAMRPESRETQPSVPREVERKAVEGTPSVPALPKSKEKVAATGTSAESVRIGAWNIEWLGKPEDRSGLGKDVAQSPDDLADCIVYSKAAAVAIEEIIAKLRGEGGAIRSSEVEGVIASLKKKTNQVWNYVLFPGRADGDQLTGVMWNTGVLTALDTNDQKWSAAEDRPWMLPIAKGRSKQGNALWNRPPHAMKFRVGEASSGRTDFVLVVMHMKADYQGDFAAHRREEAEALVGALPAVKKVFKDADIVLLGDSNCVGQHEEGIVAFEKAGLMDLNGGKLTTHWRGGTMDRIMPVGDQDEFAGAKMEVVSDGYLRERRLSPADFKRRYSDHYMVVTTVRVMGDDD